MNYPEYVLRRSELLWRKLEEVWQRELSAVAGVMHKRGAEAAAEEETVEVESLWEEDIKKEDIKKEDVKKEDVKKEKVEEVLTRGENVKEVSAVKRLAEKIFPTGSEASAETVQRFTAQVRETRDLAGLSGASDTRREGDSARWLAEASGVNSILGGSGGARWLVDELRHGTTEGVVPERVQERTVDFTPAYETADLQALSQSVERDARRYDGGFLLY